MTNMTQYAYVPRNEGATIASDIQSADSGGPAGLLIATTDGSDPEDAARDQGVRNAIYAHRVTRRSAEKYLGREYVEDAKRYAG